MLGPGWSSTTRIQTAKAASLLAANHLVLVVLAGKDLKRGLNDPTTQTQHEVEGGLCISADRNVRDVNIQQGSNNSPPAFEIINKGPKTKELLALSEGRKFMLHTLLNIVVGQRATVLQLLSGKNQTLLIRRNSCRAIKQR